jgi:hypothetical protein
MAQSGWMHDGQDSSSNNVHVHDGIVQNLDQMMEKLSNRKERGMRKQEIRISLLAFNFSAICVADAQRLLYLEAALKWQIKIY